MSRFLAVMLAVICLGVSLVGCIESGDGINGTTIGDGKVDAVEAAEIRLAVGLAFAGHPEIVAPTYGIATAILAATGDQGAVDAAVIDGVIGREVAKLGLDPVTLQSFNDLVALAKAKIMAHLPDQADRTGRLVVVRDVVEIIRQAAAARMGI